MLIFAIKSRKEKNTELFINQFCNCFQKLQKKKLYANKQICSISFLIPNISVILLALQAEIGSDETA